MRFHGYFKRFDPTHQHEEEIFTRWGTSMGRRAELDPVAGGAFAVDVSGVPFRGQYIEVDPPHRVVVSWGIAGSGLTLPLRVSTSRAGSPQAITAFYRASPG